MKAIWNKSDYPKKKNGYKVFSCFACGGGSTMGYKLAGYDVIGANDIDPQMAEIYKLNHNPKHYYLMDIKELVKMDELPEEMYHLDILDGSPPCSSFSMAGSREKYWGKDKKFREGQAEQILDNLFFDFIALAKKLQPKIVIAENVKGLISGNAQQYVIDIRKGFNDAGYDVQLFLLNGSSMGVPQRRERVFFIARRRDLKLDNIQLDFNEKPVYFKDIRTDLGIMPPLKEGTKMHHLYKFRKKSDVSLATIAMRLMGKESYFSENLVHDDKIVQTLTSNSAYYLYDKPFKVSTNDMISIQSFPQDFIFSKNSYDHIKYVLGMSVPPLMTYGVAKNVQEQLLDKA